MSDSLGPHGLQPTRLFCLWNFPGKNTGDGLPFPTPRNLPNPGIKPTSLALAGRFFTTAPPGKPKMKNCSFLTQHVSTGMLIPSIESNSLQPFGLQLTRLLCAWDSPGRILKWIAMPSSRGSSQPRYQTHVSCLLLWQAGSLPLVSLRKPKDGIKNKTTLTTTTTKKK